MLKVSATAGTFRLKFEGEPTVDIAFNAPSGENQGNRPVQSALEALPAIGAGNVNVIGGPGDATGSTPYTIVFTGTLANTDVEQLTCETGTTPLSGGGAPSVATEQDGEPEQLTRWNADGTPSAFSALGSNAIDGKGPGEDQTPDSSLEGATYIAIDGSGTATDGDIYVARGGQHALDVFAVSGKYLGRLTGFKEGLKLKDRPSSSALPELLICGVTVNEAGDLYVGETTDSGSRTSRSTSTTPRPTQSRTPTTSPTSRPPTLDDEQLRLASGAGPTAGYIFASGSQSGDHQRSSSSTPRPARRSPRWRSRTTKAKKKLSKRQSDRGRPSSGNVLAGTDREALEYDASGSTPSAPPVLPGGRSRARTRTTGLAVDGASGDLYVARGETPQLETYGPVLILPDVTTEAATEVTGTTATLNGTINAAGGPESSCHFQYTTDAAYLADKAIEGHDGFAGAQSAPCVPPGPFTGTVTNAVSAKVSGLGPETKYEFRIVGENENGVNKQGFEPTGEVPCPNLAEGKCHELKARNPRQTGNQRRPCLRNHHHDRQDLRRSQPARAANRIRSAYVTQAEFEASGYASATTTSGTKTQAQAQASSNRSETQRPAPRHDLPLPAHRRKRSGLRRTPGEDETFTTFVGANRSPGKRAYEQVSPAVKLGEVFPPEQSGLRYGLGGSCEACVPGWQRKARMPMQVTPDGNAIAYEGNPFNEGLASGPNEYIANRGGGGWATHAAQRPRIRRRNQGGLQGFLRRPLPRRPLPG